MRNSEIAHKNIGRESNLDSLANLICFVLETYGPLDSQKIYKVISCFASFKELGIHFYTSNYVSRKLSELMLDKGELSYCPITGLWAYNNSNNKNNYVGRFNFAKSVFDPKSLDYPIFGTGNECVYVLYSPEDAIASILSNRIRWKMKVGRTNNIRRRIHQLNESGGVSLMVGVVYLSKNSSSLEKFIHRQLRARFLQIQMPGRREWFNSNIQEIHSLWETYCKSQVNSLSA